MKDFEGYSHQDIHDLLIENQKLLAQNNKLLKKMNRRSTLAMWGKFIWILIILGIPFAAYYYYIGPYLTELNNSINVVQNKIQGLSDIPAIDKFKEMYNSVQGSQ